MRTNLIILKLFMLFMVFIFAPARAADSKSIASTNLKLIDAQGKELIFSMSDLLKHPKLEKVLVPKGKNPIHPDLEITYSAIKVSTLFEGLDVNKDFTLTFKAIDGFSAPFLATTADQALKRTKDISAEAYVAIEDTPWPLFKEGSRKVSAGPFYLIWLYADQFKLGSEEWPYKLAELRMTPSVEKLHPKAVPQQVEIHSSIYRGYQYFMKTCFACHSINLEGQNEAKMGPDLNMPESPIEYFGTERLKKFIRDPQTVRNWPQAKMIGFSDKNLSDQDLENIMAYLQHLVKTRNQFSKK